MGVRATLLHFQEGGERSHALLSPTPNTHRHTHIHTHTRSAGSCKPGAAGKVWHQVQRGGGGGAGCGWAAGPAWAAGSGWAAGSP